MSGLAAVLAGRKEPGVYQWHAAFHVPDVQHTVEHADWNFAYVDGWHGDSKREFLEAIGAALDFPEHYGENFDALSDCLTDVKAGEHRGTVLLWDGWGALARKDERAFAVALSVLNGRVGAHRGGPFIVLLRGEGPEVDVPSLD